ncbi:MAG: hypothetical protein ACUVWN_07820 [bacterium]
MEMTFINSIWMPMFLIQTDEFMMDSNIPRARWDEMPIHKVKISQPYKMMEMDKPNAWGVKNML